MTIEIKLQPEDTVFYLDENKVKISTVRVVFVFKSKEETSIEYEVRGINYRLGESRVFSTKEELLASL